MRQGVLQADTHAARPFQNPGSTYAPAAQSRSSVFLKLQGNLGRAIAPSLENIYHEPGKAQLDGLNSAFSLCSFAASMPFSFNMRVSLFGLVWSGLAWRPVQGGPDVLKGQVDSANLAELHIAQEDLLTSLKARLEEPLPQASRAIPAAGLEALQSQVEVVF